MCHTYYTTLQLAISVCEPWSNIVSCPDPIQKIERGLGTRLDLTHTIPVYVTKFHNINNCLAPPRKFHVGAITMKCLSIHVSPLNTFLGVAIRGNWARQQVVIIGGVKRYLVF